MAKENKKAFPGITIEQRGDPAYNAPTRVYFQGMDLRDYFAAKAMQAIMQNDTLMKEVVKKRDYNLDDFGVAKFAYLQADAMLKEREK